jgi:acetyltransferase-like isoleucine patch superfamily enzyme
MPGTVITGNTIIGSYSYIGYNCIISASKIGRYVSIANNVNIGHGEHATDKISTNTLFYADADANILLKKPLTIEDDVWIGTGAIILRDVVIGRGAIVGAGAVVTNNVPPYAVVVGVPAKIMRYRFSLEIIQKIDETKWWEKDVSEAKDIVSSLEKTLLELTNQKNNN